MQEPHNFGMMLWNYIKNQTEVTDLVPESKIFLSNFVNREVPDSKGKGITIELEQFDESEHYDYVVTLIKFKTNLALHFFAEDELSSREVSNLFTVTPSQAGLIKKMLKLEIIDTNNNKYTISSVLKGRLQSPSFDIDTGLFFYSLEFVIYWSY